jgi:hypothetical protein
VSLTEAEFVFGSVHETGLNDLLNAFFTTQPRYLNHGSSPLLFPPGTPFISIPPISFPGIPAGINFGVSFEIPAVDITPDTSGGPLPPGPGQFTVSTTVTLVIGCIRRFRDPAEEEQQGSFIPLRARLGVFARGRLIVTGLGTGAGAVSFQVDDVELVDVQPDPLESVLECLIRMMLQAVLSNVQIPIESLLIGAIPFLLALIRGPLAEADQAKIYVNV